MAEVAGLALGVIGVAGVIGAFKDTIELFNLIVDSGNLGREFEILDAKLDIEKTLLLQWAEGIGLIHAGLAPRTENKHAQNKNPPYDRRLADKTTQTMIIRALNCIEMLLTSAPDLKKRYGLAEAPEVSEGSQKLATTGHLLSGPPWERFYAEYLDWKQATQFKETRSTPAAKRIRWVIRDREKFERLVQEVGHFTSKLREILPVKTPNENFEEDLEARMDFRQLKILQEAAATGSLNAISKRARQLIQERCEDRVLARLWFRKIDDRRESITTAYQQTLEWALQSKEEEGDANWDDLSSWLRSSSGIYWVVGKAGSGKSTLMKYIHAHSRTQTLLTEWANGRPLHRCNYFFYALGTPEQKSQEGLSRTLLYQILSTHRDIIPDVLPGMCKEAYDNKDADMEDIDLPSAAETRQAFEVLASVAHQLGCFFFLIDGLDEFAGDYTDGIDLLYNLASNSQFKVIVSSRPIPECIAAFGGFPSLNLQDLNKADIELYVRGVIGGHQYMKRLVTRYPEEGEKMLDDVVQKSSGVFLWVVLACRSLVNGFAAHDRIAELRRRVDELPPELEDMFQLMLRKIEKRHREQGARLLKTCYTFYKTRSLWNTFESFTLYTLGLALVEDYTTKSTPVYDIPNDSERKELCLDLQGRLRSRCGGLLEIEHRLGDCLCRSLGLRKVHDRLIDSRVVFMHRTVFEFLSDDRVWDLEVLSLPPDDSYDDATALSIYSLHVANLLLDPVDDSRDFEAYRLFGNGLVWTSLADTQPRGDSAFFLDHMHPFLTSAPPPSQRTTIAFIQEFREKTNHGADEGDRGYISFIVAILIGAVNYVEKHLNAYLPADKHHKWCCECPSLLAFALVNRLLRPSFPRALYIGSTTRSWSNTTAIGFIDAEELARTRKIVALLLKSGCDPNELMSIKNDFPVDIFLYCWLDTSSATPWTLFVLWARETMKSERSSTTNADAIMSTVLDMLQDFLTHQANIQQLAFDPAAWLRNDFPMWDRSLEVEIKLDKIIRLFTERQNKDNAGLLTDGEESAVVCSNSLQHSTQKLAEPQQGLAVKDRSRENLDTASYFDISDSLAVPGELAVPPAPGIRSLSRTRRFKDWIKRHGAWKL